jgi:membrane protease YdiL (CAAX protease family)
MRDVARRSTLIGAAALATSSAIVLLVRVPGGLRSSADEGSPVESYLQLIGPALLGIALIRLLPWRVAELAPTLRDRRRLRRDLLVLIACAIAFPIATTGLTGSELYPLIKLALLMVLPAVLVGFRVRAIEVPRLRVAWRWWAPVVVLVAWAIGSFGPWTTQPSFDGIDPGLLIVVAVTTAITAGVGEELFYRYWLQTRLEALLGRWAGIALSSLAFALMHLGGDRQQAGFVVELAAVIVLQGSFGVLLGYLWSKYRNLALNIAIHLLANGFAVAVFLLG